MRKCSPAKTAMINHKLCDIAKENCKSKQENLLYEEAVTIRSETGAALPPDWGFPAGTRGFTGGRLCGGMRRLRADRTKTCGRYLQ